jgi:hypothetical protein
VANSSLPRPDGNARSPVRDDGPLLPQKQQQIQNAEMESFEEQFQELRVSLRFLLV